MRIVMWNILHGGGPRRLPEIALAILEQGPDVVVLCEFRAARGGQLRAVLADHGLTHQEVGGGAGEGGNAVLVASRWPLRAWPAPGSGTPGLEFPARRWVAVSVDPGGVSGGFGGGDGAGGVGDRVGAFDLLGVHIPDDTRPSAKALVWEAVLGFAGGRAGGRCVIAGDTNSGRHGVDESGSTLGCVTALGRLATMGYVDAWRRAHPESRERTWSHPWVGGTRIDGVYVSAAMAAGVVRAELVHGPREAGHSDHSMVVVEVG